MRGLVIGASSLAVIIATALMTFAVAATSTFLLSMLVSLASVGVISYGFYLWHYPILRLLRETWGTVSAWPVIGMLRALLAAQLSFKFVEVPVQGMFGRRKPLQTARVSEQTES